jgi:hypothetical protein
VKSESPHGSHRAEDWYLSLKPLPAEKLNLPPEQ